MPFLVWLKFVRNLRCIGQAMFNLRCAIYFVNNFFLFYLRLEERFGHPGGYPWQQRSYSHDLPYPTVDRLYVHLQLYIRW